PGRTVGGRVERQREGGQGGGWDRPGGGKDPGRPDRLAGLLAEGGNSKRGAEVFGLACAMCHGKDGKGLKSQEVRLNLRDPAFLALVSNRALRRIVITGRPDLGMPCYLDKGERGGVELSEKDITDVV